MKCLRIVAALLASCALLAAGGRGVEARDLLVGDSLRNTVVRLDGTTGAYKGDFVTSGSGGLSGTHGLAFGPDGNLYVCDRYGHNILRYDGQTGAFMDVFVPAGRGGIEVPVGLTFGPDGNLYVGCYHRSEILRFNGQTGEFINTFVTAGRGGLVYPRAILFGPDGKFYVGSYNTNQVLRYDGQTGAFVDVFAQGGGLTTPAGMAFGGDGHLYVNCRDTAQILRFDGTTGTFIDIFASQASGGGLREPEGLIFGPDGHLYVGNFGDGNVLRFNGQTGAFIDVFAYSNLDGPIWLIFFPGDDADHIEPAMSYTSPVAGAAQRTLLTIAGTAADNVGGSGVASVMLRLRRRSDNRYWSGSAWVTAATDLTVSGTESWSVSSALPAGSNLKEGGYLLLGSVTDNAGNTRFVNAAFTIDRTAPVSVRVTKPAPSAWVNALPSITGTAADNTGGSGIAKVTLRLRRERDGLYWRGSSWGSVAGLATTGTSSWSRSAGLPNGDHLLGGTYTLFVYAADRAGNIKSLTSTFGVDKSAPGSLTFSAPADGSVITSLSAVRGTAADNSGGSGIARVTVRLRRLNDATTTNDDLYWTGSAWTSTVATLATDNATSWSVTSGLPAGADLPPGAYWLYAYAYDRAGNVKSLRIAVTVR